MEELPEPNQEPKTKPLNLAEDYFEYLEILDEQGCPYCGSHEIVWEEDDGSYYCENCHTFI